MFLRICIVSAVMAFAAFKVSAVEVRTAADLEAAAASGETEIELTASEYAISRTLTFSKKVTIRGRSSNPRDTVIYGDGTFRIIDISNKNADGSNISDLTVSNGCYYANTGGSSSAGVLGYNSTSKTTLLSNVVVTCCRILASGSLYGHGAAVAHCILRDCKITGNACMSLNTYGAVHNCICYDSRIYGNETEGYGGGGNQSKFYHCFIYGNLAKKAGGGIYNSQCYEQTVISNNTAYTYGGGIAGPSVSSESKAYDSEICMNILDSPTKQNSQYGAGVARSVVVSNCVIRGNSIADKQSGGRLGGGVYGSTLYDCKVYDNFSRNVVGGANETTAYRCVFSNNCNAVDGAQNRTIRAEDCTFYGCGADYSCRFVNCRFLNGGLDCHLAVGANASTNGDFTAWNKVLSTIHDKNFETIVATNCLFAGNFSGDSLIVKTSTDVIDLVNCTFADNYSKATLRDRKTGETSTTVPINVINCAFPRNYNENRSSPARQDFKLEKITSGGSSRNVVMRNCLFGRNKVMTDVTLVTPEENCINNVTDMMFDTSNAEHPYSLSRKSPAIGMGLYQDWMASATDLKGDPRAHGTSVAIGCYECWQPEPGLIMFLR